MKFLSFIVTFFEISNYCFQICHNLANGWKRIWNDEQKVPYAYNGDQWVGYDDLESLEIKVGF